MNFVKFLIMTTVVFSTTVAHAQLSGEFFDNIQQQLQTSNQTPIGNGLFLPEGLEEQLSIELFPEIPKPDEEFNVVLESFSTDLNKARISWYIDEELVGSQIGGHSVTLRAPNAYDSYTVTVIIEKIEGAPIVREFTITPANVDILFEAETYVPPFYKGRPLFSNESLARFVAQPSFVDNNGGVIVPQNLVYNWKVNGSVIRNASGFGKNVLEVQGKLIQRPLLVEVEVSDLNSSLKAYDLMVAPVSNPEVALYRKDPLQGILFEKIIGDSIFMGRDEIELVSVPYFFSTKHSFDKDIDHTWSLNGSPIRTVSPQKSTMIFRNTTGEVGYSHVSVSVEHNKNILQAGSHDLQINFEEQDEVNEESFKSESGFIF